jgi:hypothetical protein
VMRPTLSPRPLNHFVARTLKHRSSTGSGSWCSSAEGCPWEFATTHEMKRYRKRLGVEDKELGKSLAGVRDGVVLSNRVRWDSFHEGRESLVTTYIAIEGLLGLKVNPPEDMSPVLLVSSLYQRG